MELRVFCEECGASVSAAARFCGQCGALQLADPLTDVSQESASRLGVHSSALARASIERHHDPPEVDARPSLAARQQPHVAPTQPTGHALTPRPSGGLAQRTREAVGGRTTAPDVDARPALAARTQVDAVLPTRPPQRGPSIPNYSVWAIREVGDGPGEPDDGLIFPVPLNSPDTIDTEIRDGKLPKRVNCTAIEVRIHGAKKPSLELRDIRAQLMVTDARLTIACSKFDKGGGWWGLGAGAVVAIPLNVGSKALAARRRRGKMLVGQIRYPWIDSVYAQNRDGWLGTEKLRVFANAGSNQLISLELTFPKQADATAVATQIIRRAASFRLAHDGHPLEAADRARLRELSQLKGLAYKKGAGKMAGQQFPSSWPASEQSARFGLERTGIAR